MSKSVPAHVFDRSRYRMKSQMKRGAESELQFVRRVVMVIVIATLVAAAWALADILLLIFGSVLVAVMLRAITDPLVTYVRVPEWCALALAVSTVIAVIAAAVLFLGPELSRQMRSVFEGLPRAFARFSDGLQLGSFTDLLKGSSTASNLGNMLSRLFAWSTTVLGALASIALVIAGGIYLAADPGLYRQGLVKLFPPATHPNVVATLDDAGEALRLWLTGQVLAMVMVGALTGIGLWLVGVESAFALGLIVGLADFVPYVGPIFAAIPIVLIASTQDWQTVVWAVGVLVVMQQIESNLIVPLVAGRMVSVAPVVGLFAVVAIGILFGPLGLLFGFPLAVVIDVAVRRLYVLDGLGQPVEIMGKPADKSAS
jgi:predicted PurR-regulated permease PerM